MAYKTTINLAPTHPGEIPRDDLQELGLSAAKFAAHLGVPTNAVSEIIAGRERVSPRMALFIGKAFGTGPEIWLNLQRAYDLGCAAEKFAKEVAAIREFERTAA
jgi:antitoxin HigA-1